MKKLVIIFLSLITAGFLVTSCSDDDEDTSTIEGKWEFYKEGLSTGGVEQLELHEHSPGCEKDFIELLSSGNYRDVFYYNEGEICTEESSTGTWSRNGNSMTIISGGETMTLTILILNDTTLKVSFPIEFEGITGNYVAEFKRP